MNENQPRASTGDEPVTKTSRSQRPEPLASRGEVAAYLGVPATTLDQWASGGTGPAYIRVGRHARYRWSDVEDWLQTQRVTPGGVES